MRVLKIQESGNFNNFCRVDLKRYFLMKFNLANYWILFFNLCNLQLAGYVFKNILKFMKFRSAMFPFFIVEIITSNDFRANSRLVYRKKGFRPRGFFQRITRMASRLKWQSRYAGFDNKIEGEIRKKDSYLRRSSPITVITRRPE